MNYRGGTVNYAAIKKTDVANGPGVRVSLFVSGCPHHCPGCFNAETWDFAYGEEFTDAVLAEILAALAPEHIRGFSLLGGEPLAPENRETVLKVLDAVTEAYPEKDIWCYTGYQYEKDVLEWIAQGDEVVRRIVEHIHVLVDGPFIMAQRNLKLPFRGSENQRILTLKEM